MSPPRSKQFKAARHDGERSFVASAPLLTSPGTRGEVDVPAPAGKSGKGLPSSAAAPHPDSLPARGERERQPPYHGNDVFLPAEASVALARRTLTQAFSQAGIDSPALDARVLLQHALGLSHAALAASGERVLTQEQRERVAALCARRLKHEPVAYITGEREFWGLPLRVTADTLIPRPDTEAVVEAALACLRPEDRAAPLRIADLGTGTGAILLALLSDLPHAHGAGTDISVAAVAVARENAVRLGFGARTVFAVGDFTALLARGFDLVVSNPPYVASASIRMLPPDVRDYEPRAALEGGADGLTFYRRLATDAGGIVRPGGRVVVEIGEGQAAAVAGLFAAAGWGAVQPAKADLSGTPRALTFRQG